MDRQQRNREGLPNPIEPKRLRSSDVELPSLKPSAFPLAMAIVAAAVEVMMSPSLWETKTKPYVAVVGEVD